MFELHGYTNIKIASRTNQRIILLNRGRNGSGFAICKDCGAAVPATMEKALDSYDRPYIPPYGSKTCSHSSKGNYFLGYDFVTDMLVIGIYLDKDRINVSYDYNPWLNIAALSLSEAFRLTASEYLDIEFSELITGFRRRMDRGKAYVDLYAYDSLSSGAGYATAVSDNLDVILKRLKDRLVNCDCSGACYNCLKHYGNQNFHGQLDRWAALQLLEWGINGKMPQDVSPEDQKNYLESLRNVLQEEDCRTEWQGDKWFLSKPGHKRKQLKIYPAMKRTPCENGVIFLSDASMKYDKPYCFRKIIEEL